MGKKINKTYYDTPVNNNDVIEAEIDGTGYNGEGIAHLGGYTVFIRNALRGEKVRALIILSKPTFAVGKLQSVIKESPDRAEPFCKVYNKCGGCGLQHMDYAAQLRFKREAVRETFFKAARLTVEPDEVVPSPLIKNYRNKMSLPVRGEVPQTGFFAEGTHRVVPIDECPIQFEGNGTLIRAFNDFAVKNGISGYNETTCEGTVRHVSARKLNGFITVTVTVNGGEKQKHPLLPFNGILKNLYGENYAYYINYNTGTGNKILGEVSELIGGNPNPVTVDGMCLTVHPHSFFQVNDGVRELLYAAAADEAKGEYIIDAYSGAGVLSAVLAKSAKHVTAIEIEQKAVDSARDLITRNNIKNVTLICGDCANCMDIAIKGIKEQSETKSDPTVVLDPPRAGCDKKVLDAVIKSDCGKIVYISCNPATLARDAAYLSADYEITRLTPFDMFPQTCNVETLCVLSKKIPDEFINIDVEFGENEGQFSLKT